MGAKDGPHPEDGEGPVRNVLVDGFSMGKYSVTNRQFNRFVAASGYRTIAEENGGSFVFLPDTEDHDLRPARSPWWKLVRNASWQQPKGPGSSAEEIPNHPVVHIARRDAQVYCRWYDLRLPTEAEWEFAARGDLHQMPFPWGDCLQPEGLSKCRTWSGQFPHPEELDAPVGPVAVGSFDANGFGLYNMTGNVWELVADRFTNLHSPRPSSNPKGPLNGSSFVAKGGSYLCHDSYCFRYRTSSRQSVETDMTADNIGFRVASN